MHIVPLRVVDQITGGDRLDQHRQRLLESLLELDPADRQAEVAGTISALKQIAELVAD